MNFHSGTTRLFLLLAFILFHSGALTAQHEVRTFTNKAGNKIEAALLEVLPGGKVKIKRKSDGREFELPIESLSEVDIQYLKSLSRKKVEVTGGGVNITLADSFDSVDFLEVEGIFVSSLEYRYFPPPGTWLTYQSPVLGVSFNFRYAGEKKLAFSVQDNWKLLLSRDDGPPKLVGAVLSSPVLPTNDPEIISQLVSLEKPDPFSVHLSVEDTSDLIYLDKIPADIPLSLQVPEIPNSRVSELIRTKEVVSLSAQMAADTSNLLSELPNLKNLTLKSTPDSTFEVTLPELQSLEQLDIYFIKFSNPESAEEQLAQVPNLKALKIYVLQEPITSFEKVPQLRALVARGTSITPSALPSLASLEFLKIEQIRSIETNSDYRKFKALNQLKFLSMDQYAFPTRIFEEWCETEAFHKLRHLHFQDCGLLSLFPELESLEIRTNGSETEFKGKRRENIITSAPASLAHLKLWVLDEFSLDIYPHPENLKTLKIRGMDWGGNTVLNRFKNVVNLEVVSILIQSKEKTASIDLAEFPNLQKLKLNELPSLKEVTNLSNHPKLKSIDLMALRELDTLGSESPNERIEYVRIFSCNALADLASLNGLRGCRELIVHYNDNIGNLNTFIQNNPLEVIELKENLKLPELQKSRNDL